MKAKIPIIPYIVLEQLPTLEDHLAIGVLKFSLDLPDIQAIYCINPGSRSVVVMFSLRGSDDILKTEYIDEDIDHACITIFREDNRQNIECDTGFYKKGSSFHENIFEGIAQFSLDDTRSFFEDLEKDPESARVFFKEAFMYCPVSMN